MNRTIVIASTLSVLVAGAGCGRSNAKKEATQTGTPTTLTSAASGVDAIPQCATYLARVAACGETKAGRTKSEEVDVKRRQMQELLNKNRPDVVGRVCESNLKQLKCG
jgi:hypothetical protein